MKGRDVWLALAPAMVMLALALTLRWSCDSGPDEPARPAARVADLPPAPQPAARAVFEVDPGAERVTAHPIQNPPDHGGDRIRVTVVLEHAGGEVVQTDDCVMTIDQPGGTRHVMVTMGAADLGP